MTSISNAATARREAARQSTGEFGEHDRSAPELALGPALVSIATEVTTAYTQRDVVPPRMRKPRDIRGTAIIRAEVFAVDLEDAPVGATYRAKSYWGEEGTEETVRVFDGDLYRAARDRDGSPVEATPESIAEIAEIHSYDQPDFGPHLSEEDIAAKLHDLTAQQTGRYRIIDGTLWEKTGEPVYRVKQDASFYSHAVHIVHEPLQQEGGTLSDHLFLATERDAAIAYARTLATRNGAEQFETEVAELPHIEVFAGYTPGTTVNVPPRIQYTRAFDLPRNWGSEGHQYNRAVVEAEWATLRDGLLAHPGAVIEVDDPFGGRTRTIDRTVVSEHQAEDFDKYQEILAEFRH